MKRAQLTGTILHAEEAPLCVLLISPNYAEPQEGRDEVATFDLVPSSPAHLILSPCLGTPEAPRVA